MKNTLKGSMKKVMGSKVGKIAVGGTMAFMIFGGGLASASYVMKTFDTGKQTTIMAKITSMGDNLLKEKAQKWWYKDDASDKSLKITTLNTEITALDAEIATLTEQVANGSPEQIAEIERLNAQIATLTTQKTTLETQKTTMESDINKLNAEVDKANSSLSTTQSMLENIESTYNNGSRVNGGNPSTTSTPTYKGVINGNDKQKSLYDGASDIKNPAYQYDANGNPILPQ